MVLWLAAKEVSVGKEEMVLVAVVMRGVALGPQGGVG